MLVLTYLSDFTVYFVALSASVTLLLFLFIKYFRIPLAVLISWNDFSSGIIIALSLVTFQSFLKCRHLGKSFPEQSSLKLPPLLYFSTSFLCFFFFFSMTLTTVLYAFIFHLYIYVGLYLSSLTRM